MDTRNGSSNASPSVAVVVTDTLNDRVIALICSLTDVDTVFTAYDVVISLRQNNPTMNVDRIEVRDMVLEEFNNTFCDEYKRTLQELTTGQYSYVYHPENLSADMHPLAVKTAPTSSIAAHIGGSDDVTDLTVEKRLNIPKTDLEKLGLVAGKQARIDVDASEGVLMLTECTSSPYETLTVNADGRLRLNAPTLKKAFGRLPEQYDITRSPDDMTIIVKAK